MVSTLAVSVLTILGLHSSSPVYYSVPDLEGEIKESLFPSNLNIPDIHIFKLVLYQITKYF